MIFKVNQYLSPTELAELLAHFTRAILDRQPEPNIGWARATADRAKSGD
jgi:hypothetical protein